MTMEEIVKWCLAKTYTTARHEFFDSGNKQIHKVKFADGDIYEHTEEYSKDNMIKRVNVKINGREVFDSEYKYESFGWQEIKIA